MQNTRHILVIRFSAMGDVAMAVPVIKNVLQQNPQLHITFVSNAFFQPLFDGLERCDFYPAYLKEKHKGSKGMLRLFKELKTSNKFDAIVDLHSVLRSSLLIVLFKLNGYATAFIDKGRKGKKELTRKENKIFHPLKPMNERYADVFRKIDLDVRLQNTSPVLSKLVVPSSIQNIFSSGKKIIGIAPFAQHQEKMYPFDKMKTVVKQLITADHTVLLFGGGKNETTALQLWEDEMPSVHNIAGKFSFKEELAIISNINVMVSMDSANMHLASLFAVPVVSIWGATHPFAGFYGWGQDEKNIVHVSLSCRPCSVFGNKPCFRGDHACMHMITEQSIIQKIDATIK